MINLGTRFICWAYRGQVPQIRDFRISARKCTESAYMCWPVIEDSKRYRGNGSVRLHEGADGDWLDPLFASGVERFLHL